MIALALSLVICADGYPLAAAMVIDGRVSIAQMGAKDLRALASDGLILSSAHLRPDKKAVVASGAPTDGGVGGLYLYDFTANTWSALDVAVPGTPHSPRFTPDGKNVIFSAAETAGSGPDHPSQVWKIEANPPRTKPTLISVEKKYCHFAPAPLDGTRIASIGTNCFFDFGVRVENAKTKKVQVLSPTHAAFDELTASFDGETLLRVEKLDADYVFTVHRGTAPGKRLYSFRATGAESTQPSFVCPRDAMFLENGVARVLNTKSGEVKTVGEGMP